MTYNVMTNKLIIIFGKSREHTAYALRSPKISREHTRMPAYHCHYNTDRTCIFHLSLPFSLRRHIKSYCLLRSSMLDYPSLKENTSHPHDHPYLCPIQIWIKFYLHGPLNKQLLIHAVYTWPFIYRYGTLGTRKSARSCLNFFHVCTPHSCCYCCIHLFFHA